MGSETLMAHLGYFMVVMKVRLMKTVLKRILLLLVITVSSAVGDTCGLDDQPFTTHPDIDLSPRVSPDGKWVAYVSRQTDNYDIWIRSTAGGRSQQVTFHKADDFYPSWSPDSRRLVFVSQRSDAFGDIWQISLREFRGKLFADGNPRQITDHPGTDSYPAISPDDKKIVWVSDRTGRDELWFYNDHTGNTLALTALGGTHPVWSPDQQLLAFTSFRDGDNNNGDIFIINLKGAKPDSGALWEPAEYPTYQLTQGKAADGFPCWSSDAKDLYFVRFDRDTNSDGCLSPADIGKIWKVRVHKEPQESTTFDSAAAALLQPGFRQELTQDAMPFTSGAYTSSHPSAGVNDRVYFVSTRRANTDIYHYPTNGHIPRCVSDSSLFSSVSGWFPVVESLQEHLLLPVYQRGSLLSDEVVKDSLAWERILGYRRIIDYYGWDSPFAGKAALEIAIEYARVGEVKTAHAWFDRILETFTHQDSLVSYARLGRTGLGSTPERPDSLASRVEQLISDLTAPTARFRAMTFLGDLYAHQGQWQRAKDMYLTLAQDSNASRSLSAASLFAAGQVFQTAGRIDEAEELYLKIITSFPGEDRWMTRARDHLIDLTLTRDTADSAAIYGELLQRYNQYPRVIAQVRLQRGIFRCNHQHVPSALEDFEEVIDNYSHLQQEALEARLWKAQCLIRMGESKQAFDFLERLIETFGDTRPRFRRTVEKSLLNHLLKSAYSLEYMGDYELARVRFHRALSVDSSSIKAHSGYVESLFYMRQIDRAIKEYEALIGQHPDNNVYLYTLGLAYSFKGTEGAQLDGNPDGIDPEYLNRSSATIARALSYNYNMVPGYLTVAFNYEMMERHLARQDRQKKPILVRVVDTATAPVQWLYRLLTFYEERKPPRYYERAVHELTKAIGLNDEKNEPELEATLALNLANNHYYLGEFDHEEAYHYYHTKIQYDSTFTDSLQKAVVYKRMGRCAFTVEDFERGPLYIQKAIALYRDLGDTETVDELKKFLALFYQVEGDYPAAISLLQSIAAKEKRDGKTNELHNSYRSLAYIHLKNGDFDQAIKYAQQAMRLLERGNVHQINHQASRIELGVLGFSFPLPFVDLSEMATPGVEGLTTQDERALLYSILGESHKSLDQFDEAINQYQLKKDLYEKGPGRANVLNALGVVSFLKGEYRKAWHYFERSYRICRRENIAIGQIHNATNLIHLALRMPTLSAERNPVSADSLHYFAKESRKIATDVLDEQSIQRGFYASRIGLILGLAELIVTPQTETHSAELRSRLESTLQSWQRSEQAMTLLNQARLWAERYRLRSEWVNVLYAQGKLWGKLTETDQAIRSLERARWLAYKHRIYRMIWKIDLALAELYTSASDIPLGGVRVQRLFEESIAMLTNRAWDRELGNVLEIRLDQARPFDAYCEYLLSVGDGAGALSIAERLRQYEYTRTLDDLKIKTDQDVLDRTDWILRYTHLSDRIDSLTLEIKRAEEVRDIARAKRQEWSDTVQRWSEELEELGKQNNQSATRHWMQMDAPSMMEIQNRINPKELILYVQTLSDRMIVWLVTNEGVEYFGPIKDAMPSERLGEDWQDVLADSSLMTRLLPLLEQRDRMVIIPDRHHIVSSWSEAVFRTFKTINSSLDVGLRSHFSSIENRKLLGKVIYWTGSSELQRSLSNLDYSLLSPIPDRQHNAFDRQISLLQSADIIHIQGVSRANNLSPLRAQLGVFIPGSRAAIFSPPDIYALSLSAQLVVLDGSFEPHDDRSLVMWKRALESAGVPTLLVTIGSVSESVRIKFFRTFYDNLQQYPAAHALRQTRHQLLNDGMSGNDLAAFQLYGFGGMTREESRAYAREGFDDIVGKADMFAEQNLWVQATQTYQQAYQMAKEQGRQDMAAQLRNRVLDTAVNGSLWKTAIEVRKQMVQEAEQRHDREAIIQGYQALAQYSFQSGAIEQGIEYRKQFVSYARRYGYEYDEARTLLDLAELYRKGSRYERAIEMYQQAAELYKAANNPLQQANCVLAIASIYDRDLDNKARAFDYRERAILIVPESRVSTVRIDALIALARSHYQLGTLFRARELLKEARTLAERGDRADRILRVQYYEILLAARFRHPKPAALDSIVRIYQQNQQYERLIEAYTHQSQLYQEIRPQLAIESLQKALQWATRQESTLWQSRIYRQLATLYLHLRQPEDALSFLDEAVMLDSLEQAKQRLFEDRLLVCNAYEQQQSLDLWQQTVEQLSRFPRSESPYYNARISFQQARLAAAKEEMPEALDHYRQSAELYGILEPEKSVSSYYHLGVLFEKMDQPDSALKAFQLATRMVHRARLHDVNTRNKSEIQNLYSDLIDLLKRQERLVDCIERIDEWKIQQHLLDLGYPRIKWPDPLPPQWRQRESQLWSKLQNKFFELRYVHKQSGTVPDSLSRSYQHVYQSYQDHLDSLVHSNPRLAIYLGVMPVSLKDIQTGLDPESAVLNFVPVNDQLYTVFVDSDTLSVMDSPLMPEFENWIHMFNQSFLEKSLSGGQRKRLYQDWIEPQESRIQTKSRLIFILPQEMLGFPVSALLDEDEIPLGFSFELYTLPWMNWLNGYRWQTDAKEETPSYSSGIYIRPFASSLPSNLSGRLQTRLDLWLSDFTSVTKPLDTVFNGMFAALQDFSYMFFDFPVDHQEGPVLSAKVGNPKDELVLRDFVGIQMLTQTVCQLSSDSHKNSIDDGAAWMGFNTILLANGVDRVVSRITGGDAVHSAVLVKRFIHYRESGYSAGKALQLAQQAMVRDMNSDPYYWAGYQLTGLPDLSSSRVIPFENERKFRMFE
jgi:tetratricopeptide (TPR) repeat protein/Tol biopolymer transport system component